MAMSLSWRYSICALELFGNNPTSLSQLENVGREKKDIDEEQMLDKTSRNKFGVEVDFLTWTHNKSWSTFQLVDEEVMPTSP